MKNLHPATLLFILLSVTAALPGCSDDTTGPATTIERDPFFQAEVRGAVASEFESSGSFYCTDDGVWDGPAAQMVGTQGLAQISINFLYADGGESTLEMVGSDDQRYVAVADKKPEIRFRSEDRQTFAYGTGTVEFTEFPVEPGGRVEATFSATLRAEDDENSDTIEIVNGVISGKSLNEEWDCK